ncbi:TlpA family protein disulfide reductase [Cellulomonas chitinilytica]|uniref:TlpA family protein disulfide reductase n=1 Tax=Cellulomonas chitinilytica TaxID=398759 RepID=UPI001EF27FED|nr:TlpA disulfide reductase family protein [Cellulomonas chitinilytica]
MRHPRRRASAALVAGLALVGLLAACSGGDDGARTPDDVTDQGYQSGDGSATTWKVSDRKGPVELAGTDFDGNPVDTADWQGDVVVLNTWYANCPPCRAEAPDLVALAHQYDGQGVHVLGINGTDAAGAAQAFQRQFEVPYPSLADSDGAAVADLQGTVPINAVPTTVVLDRDGRVAARILGLAEGSTLSAIVDDLLAEQPS